MHISFRYKVLYAIVGITAAASFAIGLLYFNWSRGEIETNYSRALWNAMTVSVHAIDENARQAYALAVSLSCDDTLHRTAQEYRDTQVEDALTLSAYLRENGQKVENLQNVYLYLPQYGKTVTSEEYHAVGVTHAHSVRWLTDAPVTGGLAPQLVYDGVSRAPRYMLSYCMRLGGEADAAVISVNLDEQRLFYQYLDRIDADGQESYYLVDGEGVVVSATGRRAIGRPLSAVADVRPEQLQAVQGKSVFSDEDGRLIAVVRAPMTGLTLVVVTDRRALVASLTRQRNFIFGFFGLVVLIMLLPAYRMSERVYAPVRRLKQAMQRVSEGDLSARASVTTRDEIGQLAEGFNEMVDRVEQLIDDLVNEQMGKKEAKLEALQYQITPHFMYNTLNSIKYAAILQGNEQVGEQLTAFIELLQASIRRSGAFITVQDEMRMVKNYVSLQQFRYGDALRVTYDLSEEAQPCCVPRLLLQPLVENAILHGRSAGGAQCDITIATARAGDTLILSVQDAGDGMTGEQLAALQKGEIARRDGFSGIGVPNIIERLTLYYGTRASLRYTTGEYGTKATIIMPATTDPAQYRI